MHKYKNYNRICISKKLSLLFIYLFLSCLAFSYHSNAASPQSREKARAFVSASLIGQLGNQFFIIAAAVSLALDYQAIPIFPDLLLKSDFGIPLNYQKIFFRLSSYRIPEKFIKCHYHERHFSYDEIPYNPNMKIWGYFQSEKYFKHHKEEILDLFAPSTEILTYLQTKYEKILSHPSTVAVHIRSYLHEDPNQVVYPTYDRKYYSKAMELFPEDSLFIVFSNDMNHCKMILKELPGKMIFIEDELYYHDFYLMSLCKHQIIANSTFSWWAAYLNPNPFKIVVAPQLWGHKLDSKDLIPPEWMILNVR